MLAHGAIPGAPGARRVAVLAVAARGRRAAHGRTRSRSEESRARFAALFHAMLERGVYLPPSAYEACFLSLAHGGADLARFAQALRESLATVAADCR